MNKMYILHSITTFTGFSPLYSFFLIPSQSRHTAAHPEPGSVRGFFLLKRSLLTGKVGTVWVIFSAPVSITWKTKRCIETNVSDLSHLFRETFETIQRLFSCFLTNRTFFFFLFLKLKDFAFPGNYMCTKSQSQADVISLNQIRGPWRGKPETRSFIFDP